MSANNDGSDRPDMPHYVATGLAYYLSLRELTSMRKHFESMAGRICNLCSERWPCATREAFLSLAASRALVAEKDGALKEAAWGQDTEQSRRWSAALALKEADMRERLEVQ